MSVTYAKMYGIVYLTKLLIFHVTARITHKMNDMAKKLTWPIIVLKCGFVNKMVKTLELAIKT